jgi:hypothetical protein
MYLEKITDPAFTSVTLARMRANSNIPSGQDEDFLTEALKSAEDYVERQLECTIGLAAWRLTLDSFPQQGESQNQFNQVLAHNQPIDWKANAILIPLWPVRAVTALTYTAVDGTTTTLPLSQIVQPVGNDRYHLRLKKGCYWPDTDESPNAIAITFNAGWPTQSAIPGTLTQAIRMLVSHFYENREAVMTGTISKEVELGVQSMLAMMETEYD